MKYNLFPARFSSKREAYVLEMDGTLTNMELYPKELELKEIIHPEELIIILKRINDIAGIYCTVNSS